MGWVLVILMSGVGIPTNASIPAPIGARLGVRRALDSTMTGPPPIVHRLLGKARFGVMVGEASELFGRAGGGGRLEGTPRCARGPPMDYGDKLLTQPSRYTFAPPHGRFLLRR